MWNNSICKNFRMNERLNMDQKNIVSLTSSLWLRGSLPIMLAMFFIYSSLV